MRHTLTALVLLIQLLTISVHAQEDQQQTLKGIKSIDVTVADLGSKIENNGINKIQIQADAELALRKAGIKISKDAVCTLFINPNIMRLTAEGTDTVVLSYMIEFELHQPATLLVNKSTVMVITWNKGYHGIAVNNNFRTIRDQINDAHAFHK